MNTRGEDSRGPVEAVPGTANLALIDHERLVELGLQAISVGVENIRDARSKDLPIGALALSNGEVIGQGVPKDVTEDDSRLHAASVAITNAFKNAPKSRVDTLVMSTEPSALTLYRIGNCDRVRRIFYVSPRSLLVEAGLVRPNKVSTDQVIETLDEPLELVQIVAPALELINSLVFSCVKRDLETGIVVPDVERYEQTNIPDLIAS
jgi:tRNA(Arg) A34 adenosine deaminase TadA